MLRAGDASSRFLARTDEEVRAGFPSSPHASRLVALKVQCSSGPAFLLGVRQPAHGGHVLAVGQTV
jgi:hypothetical protein